MFNFQASIQASSQQRALHPGPGCRTFITILGIVMSWSVAQVSAGWAAIPNAFHPLWVWSLSTWLASWLCVVQESFYFSLRKAVTSQLPSLVVTLWLSFSFFQDFVSFIMWCIQLTTFVVRYQSCMCVFPFTFCPQHHDFVWNHSPLFSSCVSQLASLFSSQHGVRAVSYTHLTLPTKA